MTKGYLLKFNDLQFSFSSLELGDMDDFLDLLNDHLLDRSKLNTVAIIPLFTPDRKATK